MSSRSEHTESVRRSIPAAIEAERGVLGSILLDPDAFIKLGNTLQPRDFFRETHGAIFEALQSMNDRREPIDFITVNEALERKGLLSDIGGPGYLTGLVADIPTALYIEHYAGIVADAALRRRMIQAAGKMAELAYDEETEVGEAIDRAEQLVFGISENRIQNDFKPVHSVMSKVVERIDFLSRNQDQASGVPTGLSALDKMLGGLQKTDLIILAARPGMGKCLGPGTKVLMYDGTLRKVEDVKTGDLLMGDDSTPRRVLGTTSGIDDMYEVHQKSGITYTVNSQHVLTLKRSRNEGGWCKGDVIDIALPEYMNQSRKWRTSFKGYKTGVEFAEQPLPLDPYIMGLWLGDGTASNSSITNPDVEVITALHQYAESQGKHVHSFPNTSGCPTHRVTEGRRQTHTQLSMQEKLRNIGVLNNKHIPYVYLRNSRANRLELLAGIIDTDGHYQDAPHSFEVTFTNRQLARDLKFLADTLGFRTSLREKSAEIKAINYQTLAWRVRISGNLDAIPTKVKRKQARERTSIKDWQVSGIDLVPVGRGRYYGFELDGNGRFLLEDMTVTHNSSLAMGIGYNAAKRHRLNTAFVSLEMSDEQLTNRVLSMETGIDSYRLRSGKVHEEEWPIVMEAANVISQCGLFIEDTPAATMADIRTKCRRLHAEHSLDLIIVDYLQLIKGNGDQRHLELSQISKGLKALARELHVPVMALSQLSRALESRHDKRPMLSDLRESGAIEEDADVVMFIYREDYYNEDTDRQNIADIIIAKHRNGSTGTASLFFRKELTQFRDLEITRTDIEY